MKAVTDFATLSKVNTSGNKSRTPLKQVFGSQGVSTSEVLFCLLFIKLHF